MPTCRYHTTLNRECGRNAHKRIRWDERRPVTGVTHELDLAFCPFHYDLTIVDLVLDCTVDLIRISPALEAVA